MTNAVDSLGRAREVLLDAGRNCVDRVNTAWQDLKSLTLTDLPPSLRLEWLAVSERADRLARVLAEPHALARMDEAGDIGTVLLCIERLARRSQSAVSFGTVKRVPTAMPHPVVLANLRA